MKNISYFVHRLKNQPIHSIQLGLERVKTVAKRMKLLHFECPIVLISGTNGKGSCLAALENIYYSAGKSVGAYSSPPLFEMNEQIRFNTKSITDNTLIDAYLKIDQHCDDVPLTIFEYQTLAALYFFQHQDLDILLLEVGMGGRQDVVNIVDATIAVITNVALDHCEWLGKTRDAIALEKMGICRQGKTAVIGDTNPPPSLLAYAKENNIILKKINQDFSFEMERDKWQWHSNQYTLIDLPLSSIGTNNLATALMVVDCLQVSLPVKEETIKKCFADLALTGRFHVIDKPVEQVFDVCHNPSAALYLAKQIKNNLPTRYTRCVFSMFKDKDISGTVLPLSHLVDAWYIAPLNHGRRAKLSTLSKYVRMNSNQPIKEFPNIKTAYDAALHDANSQDRLLCFGSFQTVSEILS